MAWSDSAADRVQSLRGIWQRGETDTRTHMGSFARYAWQDADADADADAPTPDNARAPRVTRPETPQPATRVVSDDRAYRATLRAAFPGLRPGK